jgi:3-oxoacyl-[acyl-carrier protein] reductase
MIQADVKRLLLFGASGAIGNGMCSQFNKQGWDVVSVTRTLRENPVNSRVIVIDPLDEKYDPAIFDTAAPYSAVIWAQGANLNDSVYTVNAEENIDLYRANCLFIVITLRTILDRRLLAPGARLCVISSIWQTIARQNKLSYGMTKAALQGLVLSAAADLGKDGYLINAILPGALDTPMTRQNLTPEQIDLLQSATLFGRLPTPADVSSLAFFLCSDANTSITGQSIAVDLGFSHVRIL